MLVVTAFELRHPMVLLVLVEADDPSKATRRPRFGQRQQRRADASTMQTDLHMEVGNRFPSAGYEAGKPAVEDGQCDPVGWQHRRHEVRVLLRQGMRVGERRVRHHCGFPARANSSD